MGGGTRVYLPLQRLWQPITIVPRGLRMPNQHGPGDSRLSTFEELWQTCVIPPHGVPIPTQPFHGRGESGVSASVEMCHTLTIIQQTLSPHGPTMAEGTWVYALAGGCAEPPP